MSEAWTTYYLRGEDGDYAGSFESEERARGFLERTPKWAGYHVEEVSMRCAVCGPSTKTPYYPASGNADELCTTCWGWAEKLGWQKRA